MAVGSCQFKNKMAISLHNKTWKHSFMTLTCQAEDDVFILGGTQWLTLWNWIPQCLRMLSSKYCPYSYVWPLTNFELIHFRPQNWFLAPWGQKAPRWEWTLPTCDGPMYSYQEMLVKTPSWELDLAPGLWWMNVNRVIWLICRPITLHASYCNRRAA